MNIKANLKSYIRWLVAALGSLAIALAVLVLFVDQVGRSGFFRVTDFSVSGARVGGEAANVSDEILKRTREALGQFRNLNVWQIDLAHIRSTLLSDLWIQGVEIRRILPNRVMVQVVPREPVLLYFSKAGMRPVAHDGVLLPTRSDEALVSLPILYGREFLRDQQKREAAAMLAQLFDQSGPWDRKNISEVRYDPNFGFIVQMISPKVEVRMGMDEFHTKILRVKQVIAYLDSNQLKSRVIDATFAKKVLVRLRKRS